jgi:hypothetical protein
VVLGPNARSWSLRAFGRQMDPAAPHGADQIPLISRPQLTPMLLDQNELLSKIESSITLEIPPSRSDGWPASLAPSAQSG